MRWGAGAHARGYGDEGHRRGLKEPAQAGCGAIACPFKGQADPSNTTTAYVLFFERYWALTCVAAATSMGSNRGLRNGPSQRSYLVWAHHLSAQDGPRGELLAMQHD